MLETNITVETPEPDSTPAIADVGAEVTQAIVEAEHREEVEEQLEEIAEGQEAWQRVMESGMLSIQEQLSMILATLSESTIRQAEVMEQVNESLADSEESSAIAEETLAVSDSDASEEKPPERTEPETKKGKFFSPLVSLRNAGSRSS